VPHPWIRRPAPTPSTMNRCREKIFRTSPFCPGPPFPLISRPIASTLSLPLESVGAGYPCLSPPFPCRYTGSTHVHRNLARGPFNLNCQLFFFSISLFNDGCCPGGHPPTHCSPDGFAHDVLSFVAGTRFIVRARKKHELLGVLKFYASQMCTPVLPACCVDDPWTRPHFDLGWFVQQRAFNGRRLQFLFRHCTTSSRRPVGFGRF